MPHYKLITELENVVLVAILATFIYVVKRILNLRHIRKTVPSFKSHSPKREMFLYLPPPPLLPCLLY